MDIYSDAVSSWTVLTEHLVIRETLDDRHANGTTSIVETTLLSLLNSM